MIFDKVSPIPPNLLDKFELNRADEAIRVVRELIVTAGGPLFLSFWVVDYLYMPEHALVSFLIRASFIPFSIFCLQLYKISFIRKNYHIPYFLLAEYVAVGINILAFLNTTPSNRSIYFNGFHLVTTVAFILTPIPIIPTIIVLVTLYLPQLIWQISHGSFADIAFDINMTVGFSLIIFFARYLYLKSMRQNFLSKEQLSIDAKIGENISQISHDVRTPVMALRALQSGLFDSDEGKKVLNMSIGRIIELVEEITQHASQMNIVKREVNLPSFYKECVEYINFLHPNKKIEFQNIKFEGRHFFDEAKIRRVIINLVNNAVKAADRGKNFLVTVVFDNSSLLSISIIDSGPGFENVEQAFKRGHSKFGSTGIGLSFCQNIINLHSSRLVISRTDEKTKIEFLLT